MNKQMEYLNNLEDPAVEERKIKVEELKKSMAEKKDIDENTGDNTGDIDGSHPDDGHIAEAMKRKYSKDEITEIVKKQLEKPAMTEAVSTESLKKIIIVTGGAGRIGSHLIKKLNTQGREDILLVDDLSDPSKLQNINTLKFQDYADKSKFIELLGFLAENKMIEQIYHLGAESSRSCKDGKYLMENNYQYTCNIMDICYMNQIPLVYASSATVYGQSTSFDDASDDYTPESYYALSKLQTDRYSRKFMENNNNTIIGLRYFNVTPLQWMIEQYEWEGHIELFEGSREFSRDFIPIEDAVDMTIKAMMQNGSGILNIGTGKAKTFYDLALDIVEDESQIKFIPMPEDIAEGYQKFTQAEFGSPLR